MIYTDLVMYGMLQQVYITPVLGNIFLIKPPDGVSMVKELDQEMKSYLMTFDLKHAPWFISQQEDTRTSLW